MFRSPQTMSMLNKTLTRHSLHLERTIAINSARQVASGSGTTADSMKHDQQHPLPTSKAGGGIPFARSRIGPFFQQKPVLGNQFDEDITLKTYLKRHMPDKVFNEVSADLHRFGQRVADDIYTLHLECENNPPKLQTHHAWGKRIDDIITCQAWKTMKKISAEEGLISIAYEREHGQWSRLHQVAKLYLYAPSSGLYSCPLAMTDGAAKIIENLGTKEFEEAFKHLVSRDPSHFWTSGQWMTERRGGSDVGSGTETLAVAQEDGTHRLYGYKWFSSATDSDMTMTLARVVNDHEQVIQGSKGLTMFYAEVRDANGCLNNIEVQRLKDKLGTRQLPTAELLLDGVVAYQVSEEGRGVAAIADMLTITRIHNALSSVAAMRRILNLARDYSHHRDAFGKTIKDHKLHVKHMANMEVEIRGGLLLVLEIANLMGKQEVGAASQTEQDVFRLLTPLAKLYTAKQAMSVVSEGLECFGGMGYLEDTGLPSILRDAQVLPIWEGTTNILSLDVLRAVSKSKGKVLLAFQTSITEKLASTTGVPELQTSRQALERALENVLDFAASNPHKLEYAARHFAFSLARIYIGTLLTDHAAWCDATAQDVLAAQKWCSQDLSPVVTEETQGNHEDAVMDTEYKLVMDGYKPTPHSKL